MYVYTALILLERLRSNLEVSGLILGLALFMAASFPLALRQLRWTARTILSVRDRWWNHSTLDALLLALAPA